MKVLCVGVDGTDKEINAVMLHHLIEDKEAIKVYVEVVQAL